MTIPWDEHLFVKDVVMPFLRDHWHIIDRAELDGDLRDGRLSMDELIQSHEEAVAERRFYDAFVLNELIIRYAPICRSHAEEGYWSTDEVELGISREDVSVYEQIVSPDYRRRNGAPLPRPWQ
ncbi:MAG: hypothetical protein IPM23_23705 [Candidatus Melainabacteria bacterium]|nr:hypothetical protein [Candidatus Melainabacteria bacterium]